MKHFLLTGLVFSALSLAMAHEGHNHGKEEKKAASPEKITVQGEIVDLPCFLDHGGKGKEHVKCARTCIAGGAPMGLLTKDNVLYLLVEDHAVAKAYQGLKKLAAEQVKVEGRLAKHGTFQALIVASAVKAE